MADRINTEVTSDYASVEQVAEMAAEINMKIVEYWRANSKNMTKEKYQKATDSIMAILKNDYPAFHSAYGLVLIYMIRGYYTKSSFLKYLNFIKQYPTNHNDDKYMDAVSRFVTWASVEKFPGGPKGTGWGRGQQKKFRKSLVSDMIKESNKVKNAVKLAQETINKEKENTVVERDEIYELLMSGELQALSPIWKNESR